MFGHFPINLNTKNPLELNFKWRSLRVCFTLLLICCSASVSIVVLKNQAKIGPLTPRNILGVLFFSSCFLIYVFIFQKATQWRMLMVLWMNTERHFVTKDYQLPKSKWSLKKRVFIFTSAYLTLAVVEHLFYLTNEINVFLIEVDACNLTGFNNVEVYIKKQMMFILAEIPLEYNNFLGFFLEYLNISYTFSWNFLNLFIILNSIGIAFLYDQVYQKAQTFKGLMVNEKSWAILRIQHVEVSELFSIINKNLNLMLCMAVFNDGYFILAQMINITA